MLSLTISSKHHHAPQSHKEGCRDLFDISDIDVYNSFSFMWQYDSDEEGEGSGGGEELPV